MYAVIQTGGKQYKVSPGDVLRVEKLEGDVGAEISLGAPLLVAQDEDIKVGRPLLDNVSVVGQIVAQERGKKIIVFKSKRRKGYRKKRGHRQYYTALRIKEIKEN
ncbi:MAG: 50S ribosomal protein L21 [Deltaproteobacteria bacterium]|nr:50S ribosomal protein L21 [Deltaproteobacteria bacterium]